MCVSDSTDEELHGRMEELVRDRRLKELQAVDVPVGRIIACADEATLFISTFGRPMTAWRWHTPKGVTITYESGFADRPSSWAYPRDEK